MAVFKNKSQNPEHTEYAAANLNIIFVIKIWTQKRQPRKLKQTVLWFGNHLILYPFQNPSPQIPTYSGNRVFSSALKSLFVCFRFNRVKPEMDEVTNKQIKNQNLDHSRQKNYFLALALAWDGRKRKKKKKKGVLWEFLITPDWAGDLNSICVWLKHFQAKIPGKYKKKPGIVSVILHEMNIKTLLNNDTC